MEEEEGGGGKSKVIWFSLRVTKIRFSQHGKRCHFLNLFGILHVWLGFVFKTLLQDIHKNKNKNLHQPNSCPALAFTRAELNLSTVQRFFSFSKKES